MTVKIIEYGSKEHTIECESFEFRCNHDVNWIKVKKPDGTEKMIHNICVIKVEKGERK